MSNILTLSIDSCTVEPKCKGCYVEHLKSSTKVETEIYQTELKNIYEILQKKIVPDTIIFNISSLSDIFYFTELIQKLQIIAPYIELKCIHQLYNFDINSEKFIGQVSLAILEGVYNVLSINTCMIKDTATFIEKLRIFEKCFGQSYMIELSINEDDIVDTTLINCSCADYILLNYIAHGKRNKKEIYLYLNQIKNELDIEFIDISPCVTAGLNINERPCVSNNIYDVIIKKLHENVYSTVTNKGCPFPVKTCKDPICE